MSDLPAAKKTIWLTVVCYVLAVLGVLIFANGFMLVRTVLEEQTDCHSPPISPLFNIPDPSKTSSGCWLPMKKSKLIIAVIDALRFDFAYPFPESEKSAHDPPYRHHLTVIKELLETQKDNAYLARFVADLPTATTQRILGLTAGTLPTFIDALGSFSSETVTQDSIINHMLRHSKRFHFYGDDTWLSMYPQIGKASNAEAQGYLSFHLFDLHTVDAAVKNHIEPLIANPTDYDTLVVHFLGLDHCGHKFGPWNPHCLEKLREMNTVLERLIASMEDDTVLWVMGDHGMTETGEHGGVSPREVSAALFVYSKTAITYDHGAEDAGFWKNLFERVERLREKYVEIAPLNYFGDVKDRPTITQIDFTPTLSLLSGLPIPFGNMGAIIPELLIDLRPSVVIDAYCADRDCSAATKKDLCALTRVHNLKFLLDAIRMNVFQVKHYFKAYGQAGGMGFTKHCLVLFWERLEEAEGHLEEWTKDSRVKFDLRKWLDGDRREKLPDPRELAEISDRLGEEYLKYHALMIDLLSFCREIWACFNMPRIYIGLFLLFAAILSLMCIHINYQIFIDMIPLALLVLHGVGFAASSYITFEDSHIRFFLATLIFYQALIILYHRGLVTGDMIRISLLMALVQLSGWAGTCREEQSPFCMAVSHRNYPFYMASATLGLLAAAAFGIYMHSQIVVSPLSVESKSGRFKRIWAGWILLLAVRWMYVWASENTEALAETLITTPEWMASVVIPRILYLTTFLYIIYQMACPLIHSYYRCVLAFTVMLATLQRPFGGFFLLIIAPLQLDLLIRLPNRSNLWTAAVVYFVGLQYFMTTGHQATFTAIQWESSFIGFLELDHVRGALMVFANTFGGPLVAVAYIPLLCGSASSAKTSLEVAGWLVTILAVSTTASSSFSAILMHHLMLWKVFAPRFMMQAILMMVLPSWSMASILVWRRCVRHIASGKRGGKKLYFCNA